MKKFKKLLSIALSLCILAGFATTAGAEVSIESNYKDEISTIKSVEAVYNAENGISEVLVSDEMKAGITATITDKNGIITKLEPNYTLSKVGERKVKGMPNKDIYMFTVVAKSIKYNNSNNSSKGVTCIVSICYVDNGIGADKELIQYSVDWALGGTSSISSKRIDIGYRSGLSYTTLNSYYTTLPRIDSECSIRGPQVFARATTHVRDQTGTGNFQVQCVG